MGKSISIGNLMGMITLLDVIQNKKVGKSISIGNLIGIKK